MKKVINIFGDIAQDAYFDNTISASKISNELKDITAADEIEININSFGGEVFEAVAVSNLIAASPPQRFLTLSEFAQVQQQCCFLLMTLST